MKNYQIKNVRTINTIQYERMVRFLLKNAENERIYRNMIVFGPAGVGKTKIAEQLVKESGMKLVYINLSVMEATDFLGIPQVVDGVTRWAPPDLFTKENEPSVVLLDELDKSARELQAPLLEFFQDQSIMGRKTGTKVIIATANMPDEGAFSNEISRPVANRSLIYTLQPSIDGWVSWASNNKVHPLITGYLMKNPGQILVDHESEDEQTLTKPSPRSWTMASGVLGLMENNNMTVKDQIMAIEGYVGTEAAIKFQVWLTYYVKIDGLVDDLLNGKKVQSKYDRLSMDERFVFIMSAMDRSVSAIEGSNYSPSRDDIKKLNRVVQFMQNVPPEMAIGSIRASVSPNGFIRMVDIDGVDKKSFDSIINKLIEALS